MQHQKILILDFGSQVTQLIARRVREAHVYCEVHPCDVSDEWVRAYAADGSLKGVILSGSHASVYEDTTDKAPQRFPWSKSRAPPPCPWERFSGNVKVWPGTHLQGFGSSQISPDQYKPIDLVPRMQHMFDTTRLPASSDAGDDGLRSPFRSGVLPCPLTPPLSHYRP